MTLIYVNNMTAKGKSFLELLRAGLEGKSCNTFKNNNLYGFGLMRPVLAYKLLNNLEKTNKSLNFNA